jgi:hypothetical protein
MRLRKKSAAKHTPIDHRPSAIISAFDRTALPAQRFLCSPGESGMENGPALPPELFDLIIDNLTDDLATLRSSALVSSSFYTIEPERTRVFPNLRVHYSLDKDHTAELHQLLEDSPSFAARRIPSRMRRLRWDNRCSHGLGSDSVAPRVPHPPQSRGIHWTNTPVPLRNSI